MERSEIPALAPPCPSCVDGWMALTIRLAEAPVKFAKPTLYFVGGSIDAGDGLASGRSDLWVAQALRSLAG